MFMYAVKKPAAAALGEDGTAVFCEGPGLLFASARGETPDAGITTAIFNDVEKGDIHDGDRWFPGAGSIAEVVFDMPAPLGEKLAGRLEGSVFLIDYFRDKVASLGEECDVITGTNIHVGLPAQLEMPAPHAETKPSDEMRCPVPIEEGVEEERADEREHERAAVADDEARWAGRVAELRRQGLICEDSATHAAATAAPNGIASGCPDDVAEAARCSAAASAREEAGGGEKHKAGM